MNGNRVPSYALARVVCVALFVTAITLVLHPFLHAIAWAMVVVTCSWPLYLRLRSRIAQGSDRFAASIATLIIAIIFLVVLIPLTFELLNEVRRFITMVHALLRDDAVFTEFTQRIQRYELLTNILIPEGSDLRSFALSYLNEHQRTLFSVFTVAARGTGLFLFSVGVTVFTCFYLFRYGEQLATQACAVSYLLGGEEYQRALVLAWNTIGAVLYGVVVAALMQGMLAGIGFYLFGAPLPLLLGSVTVVLGLIPFGPPLLYLPMCGYLIYSGVPWYQVAGLVVWSVAIVSTADNIFRPLFISRATSLPVLFAFFGGLGGIAAFGMIGLFLGPVLLALLQMFWRRQVEAALQRNNP